MNASVEALEIVDVNNRLQKRWVMIVEPTPLKGNSCHLIPTCKKVVTRYLKLNLFPDGGIARLEAFGKVVEQLEPTKDLSATQKVLQNYIESLPKALGFPIGFQPPRLTKLDVQKIANK